MLKIIQEWILYPQITKKEACKIKIKQVGINKVVLTGVNKLNLEQIFLNTSNQSNKDRSMVLLMVWLWPPPTPTPPTSTTASKPNLSIQTEIYKLERRVCRRMSFLGIPNLTNSPASKPLLSLIWIWIEEKVLGRCKLRGVDSKVKLKYRIRITTNTTYT